MRAIKNGAHAYGAEGVHAGRPRPTCMRFDMGLPILQCVATFSLHIELCTTCAPTCPSNFGTALRSTNLCLS